MVTARNVNSDRRLSWCNWRQRARTAIAKPIHSTTSPKKFAPLTYSKNPPVYAQRNQCKSTDHRQHEHFHAQSQQQAVHRHIPRGI